MAQNELKRRVYASYNRKSNIHEILIHLFNLNSTTDASLVLSITIAFVARRISTSLSFLQKYS